jgi:hypothetical protein
VKGMKKDLIGYLLLLLLTHLSRLNRRYNLLQTLRPILNVFLVDTEKDKDSITETVNLMLRRIISRACLLF